MVVEADSANRALMAGLLPLIDGHVGRAPTFDLTFCVAAHHRCAATIPTCRADLLACPVFDVGRSRSYISFSIVIGRSRTRLPVA